MSRGSAGANLKAIDNLEELSEDGRILQKSTIKKRAGRSVMD